MASNYLAHMYLNRGRLEFSGYGACGDPDYAPFAAVVEIGRAFQLVGERCDRLYLTGPGPCQFEEFTPTEVYLAGKSGWFGFRLVSTDWLGARALDR